MIVSHHHRFIYFAVPRTATHTVRRALQPFLHKDDWQQEHLVSRKVLPVPELAQAGHGHLGVRALRPFFSTEDWTQYYKFAFVRHPFERFVSLCSFLNRDNADFSRDPASWMQAALQRPRFRQRLLVRPQTDMLINESGQLALDFIGRYEQLDAAVDTVASRLGFGALQLTHENRSPGGLPPNCLTPELIQELIAYYHRDFELLGFESGVG